MRSYEIRPHWREDGKELQELIANDGQEILFRTVVTMLHRDERGQTKVAGQMTVPIQADTVDEAFDAMDDAIKAAQAEWMRRNTGPKLVVPGADLRLTK